MTGAPIVLVELPCRCCAVLAMKWWYWGPPDEGLSAALFLDARGRCGPAGLRDLFHPVGAGHQREDFVLANTVVEAPVRTLNSSFVPVLWWLHDAFAGYPFISHSIPKALGKNDAPSAP